MEDTTLAARLAGTRVILCYGLFGELMAGLRPLGLDYMQRQRAWLAAIGVHVAVARLPTAAAVAANAAKLGEMVLGDNAPAILVGHSKGGVEALSALLLPGVAAQCRGFLALQSPFHGSPVADAALGIAPLRGLADHVLRLARIGDADGLRDLTCATRGPWMEASGAAIRALTARLPVTSLATAIEHGRDIREHAYLPLARWMEREGAGPSDGLVPVSSTLLPGARHAVLPGGHRALVAGGTGRDPIGLLRREIAALLDRG
ncbi:hypothetical protein [Falsiroseomonas oryziterrae]|uniref:hypothetical protein n=1 Tax=Falsiroseomonas oryziterrae TaxID=2911368 RepID=UPI001F2F2E41|nr:hypothetical protein [Roseomonas sp. NPKOSM-4]